MKAKAKKLELKLRKNVSESGLEDANGDLTRGIVELMKQLETNKRKEGKSSKWQMGDSEEEKEEDEITKEDDLPLMMDFKIKI